jgi:hypothetical protein
MAGRVAALLSPRCRSSLRAIIDLILSSLVMRGAASRRHGWAGRKPRAILLVLLQRHLVARTGAAKA